MTGHLRAMIGEAACVYGRRRDPMSGAEIDTARALKATYRCGWQNVAAMMGRNVDDVRRWCDPTFVQVAYRPAPAAAPLSCERAAVVRRPAVAKAVTLADVPGGVDVLRLLADAGAGPDGRFVMSTQLAEGLTRGEAGGLGVRLSRLTRAAPALVERVKRAGNVTAWRLTAEGLAAIGGEA